MPNSLTDWIRRTANLVTGPAGTIVGGAVSLIKKLFVEDPAIGIARDLLKQWTIESERADARQNRLLNQFESTQAAQREELHALMRVIEHSLPTPQTVYQVTTFADIRDLTLRRQGGRKLDAEVVGRIAASPSHAVRDRLQRVNVNPTRLDHYVRQVAEEFGILVVSGCVGRDQLAGATFLSAMRQTAEIRAAGGARPLDDTPETQARAIPSLVVADDLIPPDVRFTDEHIAILREFLGGVPTICVQGDLDARVLHSWWWLPGDDHATQATYDLGTHHDAPGTLAQLITLIISDAFSLGSFEGAAALPRAITLDTANPENRQALLDFLTPFYMDVCAANADNFGPLGLESGCPVSSSIDEWLLKRIHFVLKDGFHWGSGAARGLRFEGWSLFVLTQRSREHVAPGAVYVLAMRRVATDKARLRIWRSPSFAYPSAGWERESPHWRNALDEGLKAFMADQRSFEDCATVDISPQSDALERLLTDENVRTRSSAHADGADSNIQTRSAQRLKE